MNLVTTPQMQEIDSRAQTEFLIPGLMLMEQAGVKGFHAAVSHFDSRKELPILFISGSGNNGGDALVMAREASLMGFTDLKILCLKRDLKGSAGIQLNICRELDIPIYYVDTDDWRVLIIESDMIFDGMVGTGLKGPLRPGILTDVIKLLNACTDTHRIAIDLPSGLTDITRNDDIVFDADLTISFGTAKLCCYLPHTRMLCGEILQINPGFPKTLIDQYGPDKQLIDIETLTIDPLSPDMYKNRKGHLAVFAGSVGYTGAATLCAEAALRSGSGLVTLYCDTDIYPILATMLRSVIVRPVVKGQCISALELCSGYDAVLTGPGWGAGEERETQLLEILKCDLPLVLDADGIRIYERLKRSIPSLKQPADLIITPHPGEFRGLSDETVADSPHRLIEILINTARRYDAVILYKSFINYVVDPLGGLTVMEGLNPELGTAGSGDILAGVVASNLAQGRGAQRAAVIGNCIHQLSGRYCREQKGSFIAEDLLPSIGTCRKSLEKEG